MAAVTAFLMCLVVVEVRAGRHHRRPQQLDVKWIREVAEDCIDQGPPCHHCLRKVTKKFGCLEEPTKGCGVHRAVMYEAVRRNHSRDECGSGLQCQAVHAIWGSEHEEERLAVAFHCVDDKSFDAAEAPSPHVVSRPWDI